jgi:hypothetical protein
MVVPSELKKLNLDLNCQLAGGRNDEGLRGLAGGVLGVDTCSQQLMQDTEKDSHLIINQLRQRINDGKESNQQTCTHTDYSLTRENYVTPVVSVFPFPRIPNTLMIIPKKRTTIMHFVATLALPHFATTVNIELCS